MRESVLRFWGIAISVVALALFFRLARISHESVDGDEMFSLRIAEAETPQAWSLIRQDLVHPPLYYLLLNLTLPTTRPASALDLRMLSLASGAALLVVVTLAGWVVLPLRGPAILTAFLLALNKTQIFYSQQARSYALFCLVTGLLLLWSLLLDRYQRTVVYWLAGTVLMTTLLYIHYFACFYCAAVVLPIVLASRSKQTRVRAVLSLMLAFTAFLPWISQESSVYRENAGLSRNLGWMKRPSVYDLNVTLDDNLGEPDFDKATNLELSIGAVLVVLALLPGSREHGEWLDIRIKTTLALLALMPPVVCFLLAREPLLLPIFGERHLLPSMPAALILVSFGLWRLASLAAKPLRVAVLVTGVVVLAGLQLFPVWKHWHGTARVPYEAIANRLRMSDSRLPVYTTWYYGIAEPVSFYLKGSMQVQGIPLHPAEQLPDKCILLYRPASDFEIPAVLPILESFDVLEQQYYSADESGAGTRLVVLQRRAL